MKRIALLGATGSIGRQTLELIDRFSERFSLYAASGRTNIKAMETLVERFTPRHVIMPSDTARRFDARFVPLENLIDFMNALPEDVIIVNALVGTAGLHPSVAALQKGHTVLLANKESLVTGGALIERILQTSHGRLIPIDSEHSALRVLLRDKDMASVDRIVLTASGGSLRDTPLEQFSDVTPEAALAHPSWTMGAKVTVDSSTMMNKVFEVIEAHWLFGVPYDKIDAVLHRESIVHALVHFRDGNVTAHVGPADMHIPILTALEGKTTLPYPTSFRIENIGALHFTALDDARYPLYALGLAAAKKGGVAPVVLNAANEAAVDLFLKRHIPYPDIYNIVQTCLRMFTSSEALSLKSILALDKKVKEYVMKHYTKGDTHDNT